MIKYIVAYLGAGLTFAAIDAVWLTTMTNRLYKPVLGPILADKPDMKAAVAFYLISIFGTVFLAIEPALPRQWQAGQNSTAELPPIRWKRKALASLAYMAAVKYQLRRLSQGRRPNPGVSPLRALLAEQLKTARRARQYRRLMASA